MVTVASKQTSPAEITTLLGKGATFDGKLTFEGAVRISGKFKGEVFSNDTLIVGEGAHVDADIDVGEIIIHGTVVGNVKAKRSIEIHAPGRVKGDLTTPMLQIDKGVIFEGRSQMETAVSVPQPRTDRAASQPVINPAAAPVKPAGPK
jgi:cytoskeletal protein CcmA (bactofilin family)